MDVYLTEQELQREKNLKSAHDDHYRKLIGKKIDLKNSKPTLKIDQDAVKPPPSC